MRYQNRGIETEVAEQPIEKVNQTQRKKQETLLKKEQRKWMPLKPIQGIRRMKLERHSQSSLMKAAEGSSFRLVTKSCLNFFPLLLLFSLSYDLTI